MKIQRLMIENIPAILIGSDNLTQRDTVERFTEKFHCKLTVMDNGEHWFHTQEQLNFPHNWEADNF